MSVTSLGKQGGRRYRSLRGPGLITGLMTRGTTVVTGFVYSWLGDLTTIVRHYLQDLEAQALVQTEETGLLVSHIPTIRAAVPQEDDLNTAIYDYLT